MISIVIPIWDEPNIRHLVEDVRTVMADGMTSDFEIIIVSRGFSHSAERLDFYPRVYIITQKSVGLGNAILEGVEKAKGDIIVTMDGDGSHDPKYLPTLIDLANHYDIVVGSKYCPGGKNYDSGPRHALSRASCMFAKWVLGLKTYDVMSGFSAIKKEIYESTSYSPLGYKLNMEIMFKNKERSLAEFPIEFRERKGGISKFGKREFLRTGFFVFKLWSSDFWVSFLKSMWLLPIIFILLFFLCAVYI